MKLCRNGECKVAKEVGPEVHLRLELAVLCGIGAAIAFRRGQRSKGMKGKGFPRAASKTALRLFRGVGCLAAYADTMGRRLAEFQMLERMLGDDDPESESRS